MHEDRSKTVELEFYSVQLREKIAAPDTDINITLAENGRRHARATVQRDGTAITLFTFLPANAPAAVVAATMGTTSQAKT